MNNYIALAGYFALGSYYVSELSNYLRARHLRGILITILAVAGCALLTCHFAFEARAAVTSGLSDPTLIARTVEAKPIGRVSRPTLNASIARRNPISR